MSTKKPTRPKVLFVKRTDSSVQIRHEAMNTREQAVDVEKAKAGGAKNPPPTKEVQSSEEIDLTAHDAPLESFDKALQALAPVAAKALGYAPDGADGMEVVSLAISYTEAGIRTATVGVVKKCLGGEALHPLKTPAFQIDDGKTADQGRRQCAPNHAERVAEAIKEAQRYLLGERGQGVLGFEEEEEDDKQTKIVSIEQARE